MTAAELHTDRADRALAGFILGDDGLPDAELVAILAADIAEALDLPELAADAELAASAPTARQRHAAVRRLLNAPAVLAAIPDTPTGKLVESIQDGRAY